MVTICEFRGVDLSVSPRILGLEVPRELRMVVSVMLTLSSAINPFIYAIYSTKFRHRMRSLLGCPRTSPVITPGP